MARDHREDLAGATHHVYAHAQDGERLYRDDDDRRLYLRLLGRETERRRWRMLAYCLMSNHVHLLLETTEPNLGSGMQALHGDYARAYNDRHARRGHVFRSRYGAVRATTTEQACTAATYIAHNPVEAGLCRRAEDFPWSSHGERWRSPWLDLDRLHSHFASFGGDGREQYAAAVARRLGEEESAALAQL